MTKRFHVHGIVSDVRSEEEVATVSITVEADDDGDAQTLAWELFDDEWYSFDVTEIEEADPVGDVA